MGNAFVLQTNEHDLFRSNALKHSGSVIFPAYEDLSLVPSSPFLHELDKVYFIVPRPSSNLCDAIRTLSGDVLSGPSVPQRISADPKPPLFSVCIVSLD